MNLNCPLRLVPSMINCSVIGHASGQVPAISRADLSPPRCRPDYGRFSDVYGHIVRFCAGERGADSTGLPLTERSAVRHSKPSQSERFGRSAFFSGPSKTRLLDAGRLDDRPTWHCETRRSSLRIGQRFDPPFVLLMVVASAPYPLIAPSGYQSLTSG